VAASGCIAECFESGGTGSGTSHWSTSAVRRVFCAPRRLLTNRSHESAHSDVRHAGAVVVITAIFGGSAIALPIAFWRFGGDKVWCPVKPQHLTWNGRLGIWQHNYLV